MLKLPITDEFLWDLFNLYLKIEDILNWPPHSMREAVVPPKLRLKRILQKKKSRYTFKRLIDRLSQKGYIKLKSLQPEEGVLLTEKGNQKLLEIALTKIEKKKRKDGKWLMVIFDIPEKLRKLRDLFRENLYFLGFKELQKSVWISPFDVLEEVQLLTQRYSLQKYIKLFLIQEQEIVK